MKYEMKYRENQSQKLNKFVGEEKEILIAFGELIKKHSFLNIKIKKINGGDNNGKK